MSVMMDLLFGEEARKPFEVYDSVFGEAKSATVRDLVKQMGFLPNVDNRELRFFSSNGQTYGLCMGTNRRCNGNLRYIVVK